MTTNPPPAINFAAWTLSLFCAAVCGCGGSTPKPKAPPVIKSPPTPTNLSSTPSTPSPAPSATPSTEKTASIPEKATKSRPPKVDRDQFADEDPKNVFLIPEDPANAQIGGSGDAFALNGFVIGELPEEADAKRFNSTLFEVLAVDDGSNTNDSSSTAQRNPDFELPEGFQEVPSYGYSERGLPLRIRDEKAGALMALVPGGAARIGSHDGPPEARPEFSPFLETYYMDVTEVTLEQYQRFRDDIKQKKNMTAQPALNDRRDSSLPALGLPWGNALGFARWAGKELPTEAEWENAARGGQGWRTPWGDGRAVWPQGRDSEQISPVAKFPTDQSIYGIYDLAGNAREWCSDHYSPTSHEDATQASSRALVNWAGTKKGVSGQRVVKGNGPDWSAWHRQGRAHNERHADVGFRCVLRVKVPQTGDSKGD